MTNSQSFVVQAKVKMRRDIIAVFQKIEESKLSNEDSLLKKKDDENDECNEGPLWPGFKDTSLDRITRFAARHNVEYESPPVV